MYKIRSINSRIWIAVPLVPLLVFVCLHQKCALAAILESKVLSAMNATPNGQDQPQVVSPLFVPLGAYTVAALPLIHACAPVIS